eukprot:scaffold258556_cov49-Prasinocladus_malaysianus.AAC.1
MPASNLSVSSLLPPVQLTLCATSAYIYPQLLFEHPISRSRRHPVDAVHAYDVHGCFQLSWKYSKTAMGWPKIQKDSQKITLPTMSLFSLRFKMVVMAMSGICRQQAAPDGFKGCDATISGPKQHREYKMGTSTEPEVQVRYTCPIMPAKAQALSMRSGTPTRSSWNMAEMRKVARMET